MRVSTRGTGSRVSSVIREKRVKGWSVRTRRSWGLDILLCGGWGDNKGNVKPLCPCCNHLGSGAVSRWEAVKALASLGFMVPQFTSKLSYPGLWADETVNSCYLAGLWGQSRCLLLSRALNSYFQGWRPSSLHVMASPPPTVQPRRGRAQ